MSIQHKDLTGADLHEPKGVATATAGQVYVANGSGSGAWSDPLADINNLNSFDMNGVVSDVSTPNTEYYIRVARDCTLTHIYGVMGAAITGTDAVLSLYRDGILLGQTVTVPVAGSGAGVKISKTLAPTYDFTAGQVLRVVSNGASTDPSAFYFTAVFTV
jgi:hypothetical protein